jgi:hypothetical protein
VNVRGKDVAGDVFIAQGLLPARPGVLLAAYLHQVGRHGFEVACIRRIDTIVPRFEVDDVIDDDPLVRVQAGPQPVEGDDRSQYALLFKRLERRWKCLEHRLIE